MDAWTYWAVFLGVIAAAVAWAAWDSKRKAAADEADGVIASLDIPGAARLRLTNTALLEGDSKVRHPLTGLSARVEEGGTVNRRFTVTRIVALGVLAAGLPKKIDDRMLYLTIEGPSTIIVHEIPLKNAPQMRVDARTFAAKINSLAQATEPFVSSTPRAAPPAPSSLPAQRVEEAPRGGASSGIDGLMGKLRELEQLRASGLISEDEYAAKRVSMLEQL